MEMQWELRKLLKKNEKWPIGAKVAAPPGEGIFHFSLGLITLERSKVAASRFAGL